MSDKKFEEVLGSTTLLDGFFHVEELRLRHSLTNGQMSNELSRYILNRPDAVCAVVVNRDNQSTYLVRQFRVGALKKESAWVLEIAAGLLDDGETPEVGIRREVQEELGFTIDKLELIEVFFPSPGIISERVFLHMAEVCNENRVSDGGGVEDEDEDLEVVEVPLNKLEDFILENPIKDAKTLIGISHLRRLGLI